MDVDQPGEHALMDGGTSFLSLSLSNCILYGGGKKRLTCTPPPDPDSVDMNEYDPLSSAPPGSLSAYSMGASTATATATALGSGTAAGKASTRDQHPPAKRYRMTEGMKNKVWQLVLLSNECCRLENEKK